MKNKHTYRKGLPADVTDLAALGLASYGQFKNSLNAEGWARMGSICGSEHTYVELLKIARCFICEENNNVIGMAFLIPSGNPLGFFQADWAYIRLIGVAPGYEGQGIGRKLTQQCIDSAKQSGEKTVALHTSEFQGAARHIYESLGFKKLKELDPIYNKQYWLYTLSLNDSDTANEIHYHRAVLNDIPALIELRIRFTSLLTGIHDEGRVKELRKNTQGYFTEALTTGSSIWIIGRAGTEAIATGGLIIRQQPPNFKNPDGRMGYLVNMYTIPEFRRKGICSTILNRLLTEAKQQGIRAFELHATKEGELVYKQSGFEIHDEPTYRKYT